MRWLRPLQRLAGRWLLPASLALAHPLALSVAPSNGTAPQVVVLSSESSAPYQEAANALRQALVRDGLSPQAVQLLGLDAWPGAFGAAARLHVALGSAACARVVAVVSQAPVLCALIPLESFEHILQQHQRNASPSLTALVLNQPLGRQLELIRLALPAARRVGVLWGPQSLPQAGALRDAARSRGLELREANVTSDTQLASSLRLLLASTDVLLAIAEASLYNARTVESILYSAMREHVPVVSFSPSYSRAGAVLALYATPTQVGNQAAALARRVLQGYALPAAPVAPADFSVDVNQPVARALGLALDANDLLIKLRQREGLP